MGIVDPSIRAFLEGVFGDRWEDVWIAQFKSFPTSRGDWTGKPASAWAQIGRHTDLNLFFTIALMKPGSDARSIMNLAEHRMVIADDIGTKVSKEKWDEMLAKGFPRPTFKIETSPGNETWGWVFEEVIPVGDPREADVTKVRALMAANGLSDVAVVQDPARYIRLPGGWNSKPKYEQLDGSFPDVWACEQNLSLRASLDDMGRALAGDDWREAPLPMNVMPGVKLAAMAQAGMLNRSADMNRPEPIIQLAQEIGLAPVQIRQGVVQAECPNAANHTDGRGDGFAFLGNGLMQCMHDHCQHLTSTDFRQMICEAYDAQEQAKADAKAAVGIVTVANTANGFLAAADFAQHGGLDASGVDAVQAEAEQLASGMENARLLAEQDLIAAADRLAQRFVYVDDADAMFDTVTRGMVGVRGFNRHSAVRTVFPYNGDGAKSALHRLLNHSMMRSATTLTYKPGDLSSIVQAEDARGMQVDAVNLWTPSTVGVLAQAPKDWLEMVEYLYPDAPAREWLLDWMAFVWQNPTKRTVVVPLLIGGQGTGKDLMLEPFVQLIGAHNTESVSPERMESGFNEWQRARLVIFAELKLGDAKLYNRIKDWTGMGDKFITINEKYQRPYRVKPVMVFIAMTNHLDALDGLEADDRRWGIYVSPAVPRAPAWYQAMGDKLRDPQELARVRWFLEQRDVKNFNPWGPAPDFGWREIVAAESLSAPARWVYDECKNGRFKDRVYLTIQEVQDAAAAYGDKMAQSRLTSAAVRQGLVQAGCAAIGQVRAGRDRVRLWHGPATAGNSVIREVIEKLPGVEQAARHKAEVAAHAQKGLGLGS